MSPSTTTTTTTTTPNGLPNHSKPTPQPTFHPSTLAIHADDHLNNSLPDVAPPLHVSTTFRYASDPSLLIPAKDLTHSQSSDSHIYSRETAPTTTRAEALLSSILHAPAITYASGLAALHALYIHLHPRRVAITGGYHGTHGVLALYAKLTGAEILPLDCSAEELGAGDVIHLETPVNPTGEARDIKFFAERARERGAVLVVDATFGPPGLQDPFAQGADVVMHSGTKYLGGHSDLLWGVLATQREEWVKGLREERTFLGSVMGGLEGWLGVRSLRTLEVRVRRQSESAGRLVRWLDGEMKGGSGSGGVVGEVVEVVKHASLQVEDMGWLKEQMPGGFGPVFALVLRTESMARRFPSTLRLFHHATSLGGVESLIEWRAMSDKTVDTRLLRVSVGLEHWEDLRDDMARGFRALVDEK